MTKTALYRHYDDPVVIVRGTPGSGKTTFAKSQFPDRELIEADHYFMIGGKYFFDGARIKDAHKWCLWRATQAANNGIPVVVANTFTRLWEMEKYLDLWPSAPVFRCVGDWGNVHGVPADAVARMKARFECFPGEHLVPAADGDAA